MDKDGMMKKRTGDVDVEVLTISTLCCDSADTTEVASSTDELRKLDIERLGRERPPIFTSTAKEVFFVCSIVLSLMMSEYFTSGFNIILPSLADAVHLPQDSRTWPTAVPNLAAAAFLLPFARLCNMLSARLVFMWGHVWLMAWSVVTGFCSNYVLVIICRAMQGIGFAAFLPAGVDLLGQVYRPGPRKNLVYSIYGAFACVGFYFGIIVAATTTEFIDWRWYFWVGAMLQLATIGIGWLAIPNELNEVNHEAQMDWRGMATIVPGLALFIFAFTEGSQAPQGWKTPYILITLISGAAFLVAAIYVQGWVSEQPLFPRGIIKIKCIKRLMGGIACYFGVCSMFLLYTSLFIQDILHVTPLKAAAWYSPMLVGGIILAVAGGMILHIIPNRILLIISSIGFLLSVMLFALIPTKYEAKSSQSPVLYWAFIFPAMCCGTLGIDLTFNVMNIFITTALPKRDQAAVGALTNTLIYLGGSFWLSISELVIATTKNVKHGDYPLVEQYKTAFWLATGLSAFALGLVVTIRMGTASAELTADEKEVVAQRELLAQIEKEKELGLIVTAKEVE